MTFTKPLAQQWGETIRRARIDQGLSLEALAEAAEIDPGHLSRAERGKAGLGDEMRIRIARALHKRVEDLFPYPDTTQEAS